MAFSWILYFVTCRRFWGIIFYSNFFFSSRFNQFTFLDHARSICSSILFPWRRELAISHQSDCYILEWHSRLAFHQCSSFRSSGTGTFASSIVTKQTILIQILIWLFILSRHFQHHASQVYHPWLSCFSFQRKYVVYSLCSHLSDQYHFQISISIIILPLILQEWNT